MSSNRMGTTPLQEQYLPPWTKCHILYYKLNCGATLYALKHCPEIQMDGPQFLNAIKHHTHAVFIRALLQMFAVGACAKHH